MNSFFHVIAVLCMFESHKLRYIPYDENEHIPEFEPVRSFSVQKPAVKFTQLKNIQGVRVHAVN